MTALKLPERLQNHRGFARTFQPGKLTLGLIAPFKGYPDSPVPEMDDFATVIKAADQSGIARCGCAMCRFTTRVLAMSRRFTTRR